jgi:protocatechuate 3,4-dioxygenase beta subunit
MRGYRRFVAAAVIAASGAGATAQVHFPGAQPRDQRPGTAVIRGRVIDAATGSPVARARVRVSGQQSRPVVLTGVDGRFVFTGVSQGALTLTVEKATYTPAQYPQGGRTLRTMRRPLLVTEGALVDNVTIPLYRVSAISGRVLDVHGDPVDYAHVRVVRVDGPRGSQVASGASTNELGEFRAGRIEPGTYVLQAVPHDRGWELPADVQPIPTFHPATLAIDQAQRFAIRRGQSIADLDVVLLEGTPNVVTGTVVDSHGQPVKTGHVNARSVGERLGGWATGGAGIKPDGTFQLKLAAGEYMLEAQGVRSLPPESSRSDEDAHSGSARVSVTGGPLDVVIRVGPPSTISGSVVFDGMGALPDPKQVQLHAGSDESGNCRSGRTEVRADWTFTLTGVAGACTFDGGAMAWRLRSIVVGQEDFAGRPLALESGQELRGVKVILSDRRSGVRLHVDDEQGLPTREYVAIVFSTDKERWKNGWNYVRTYVPPANEFLIGARPEVRVQPGAPAPPTPRPDMMDVLPGDYFAIAIDDIEAEDARNPAVLEKLMAHAAHVTVTDGTHSDLGLRRVKKP